MQPYRKEPFLQPHDYTRRLAIFQEKFISLNREIYTAN